MSKEHIKKMNEILTIDTNTLAINEFESMDYLGSKDVQTVDIKNSRIRHLFHRRTKNDNCGYCVDIYGIDRDAQKFITVGELWCVKTTTTKLKDLE